MKSILPAFRIEMYPEVFSLNQIFENMHLLISKDRTNIISNNIPFSYFCIDKTIIYVGFADDFGPMSLASTFSFCELLDDQLKKAEGRPVAYHCQPDPESVTNAAFLLGAYLIMRRGFDDVAAVEERLAAVAGALVPYRDVSKKRQTFGLHVRDCWGGLLRARQLRWVDFGPEGFDLSEYEHYDSPLNADLHEVVPGKLIAMRGPRDVKGGALWADVLRQDGGFSHREFSPAHSVDALTQFDVRVVVRLNAPGYDARPLREAGIAVADLVFEDCTPPPVDVVAKFLAIAEGVEGAVAVHCKAGLGRTGTLIALYMMKHHGFSAREAMGWIRIVRPGRY
jgi:cell division cycle 14